MRKLLIGCVTTLALAAVVWAQSQAPADDRSVEARLRAIEDRLGIGQKDQPVADAKTFDDLKAALVRMEREQDRLAVQVQNLAAARTRANVLGNDDLQQLERDVAGLRSMVRDLGEQVRRLETRRR